MNMIIVYKTMHVKNKRRMIRILLKMTLPRQLE